MFRTPRIAHAILVISVLLLCSAAFASSPTWTDSLGNSFTWNDGTLSNDFSYTGPLGELTTPPSVPYVLSGETPYAGDPNVFAQIYNATTSYWTDWHINITNGYFMPTGTSAYNMSVSNPNWVVELSNPDSHGNMTQLFAHVVSGQNTQVLPGETLYLAYKYASNGGTVKLTQYPTATYAVPEPGSCAAVSMSLLALVGIIKRRK